MAQIDAARLAAVLAADADVEVGPRLAAELDGDLHDPADAALVERRERVLGQDALLQVLGQEPGLGVGALIAADGKLIVLGEKGELAIIAASPDGYEELARAQLLGPTCWTQPTLANGRIYLRSGKGDVVCVSGGVVE